MWPQESADLVTFTEEILNGKFHFLCSACWVILMWDLLVLVDEMHVDKNVWYLKYFFLSNFQLVESEVPENRTMSTLVEAKI